MGWGIELRDPISFNIEGKQHITIAAGHTLYVFGLN